MIKPHFTLFPTPPLPPLLKIFIWKYCPNMILQGKHTKNSQEKAFSSKDFSSDTFISNTCCLPSHLTYFIFMIYILNLPLFSLLLVLFLSIIFLLATSIFSFLCFNLLWLPNFWIQWITFENLLKPCLWNKKY